MSKCEGHPIPTKKPAGFHPRVGRLSLERQKKLMSDMMSMIFLRPGGLPQIFPVIFCHKVKSHPERGFMPLMPCRNESFGRKYFFGSEVIRAT